jgi:predicted RNase H-like HicB family nuclease
MTPKQRVLSYTAIFEPLEGGSYMVTVPALPGLVTQGDDLAEARLMAEDAIQCHLAGLIKDGEPIPEDVGAPARVGKIRVYMKSA